MNTIFYTTPINLDETKKTLLELDKEGTFNETEQESNGYVIKTLEFIGKGGKFRYKQSFTERVLNENEKLLKEYTNKMYNLNLEKDKAVFNEDYVEAAKIKNELNQIKSQIKQLKEK